MRDHRYLLFTMFSDVVKRKVPIIGSITDLVVDGRAFVVFVVDIYDFDLGQLRSNVPKFTFFLF